MRKPLVKQSPQAPKADTIWNVPRNDPKAALAFYQRSKAAGTWNNQWPRVLLMLQDDPKEMLALLDADALRHPEQLSLPNVFK